MPKARRYAGSARCAGTLRREALSSSGSKMADAFALLFAKKYREALPLLQAAYGETNPSADGQVRTLLAWAFVETGAIDKAGKLLDSYPLPLSSGEQLFASLIFPRYLFLRGAFLEQAGKRDEARKSYELYLKYAETCRVHSERTRREHVRAWALRSDGFVFPGLVGVALIAVLDSIVEMQIGRCAQAFVIEAGQAEAFL